MQQKPAQLRALRRSLDNPYRPGNCASFFNDPDSFTIRVTFAELSERAGHIPLKCMIPAEFISVKEAVQKDQITNISRPQIMSDIEMRRDRLIHCCFHRTKPYVRPLSKASQR